ncbi:hypothetical protein BDV26DRAFT_61606 [Aspergillus bertholletiae]|uniref:Uncharacterized protein n=1 Tax=Aspergillus bertholletiae TaxID=1226010 RepID=A0A5N7AXQ4_9EURO|nr:hypothetical protein BDV26DRAFT_61606 [Aspergillus bertholletiae]
MHPRGGEQFDFFLPLHFRSPSSPSSMIASISIIGESQYTIRSTSGDSGHMKHRGGQGQDPIRGNDRFRSCRETLGPWFMVVVAQVTMDQGLKKIHRKAFVGTGRNSAQVPALASLVLQVVHDQGPWTDLKRGCWMLPSAQNDDILCIGAM